MPFLDTNSHLTAKTNNFDIKCQSNSESYDRHGFWDRVYGGVSIFYLLWEVFFNKREYSVADWLELLLRANITKALKDYPNLCVS